MFIITCGLQTLNKKSKQPEKLTKTLFSGWKSCKRCIEVSVKKKKLLEVLNFKKILQSFSKRTFSPVIHLLKVNNGNTRTMCEICLKLTTKTPERHQ